MPAPVIALIAALGAITVGGGAWSERLVSGAPLSWAAVLGLLFALAASAYLHVEFRHGDDDVNALDLLEVALAPTLLLVPGIRAVVLVAVATSLADALLRVRPVKAAFNVCAWSAAAAVGSVVVGALDVGRPYGLGDLLALAVAMLSVVAVNQLAYVCVLRLSDRHTFGQVLAELRPTIVPAWLIGGGVTLAFGLLFAAATASVPVVAWLVPVPLVALHWASQSYAANRARLAQTEGLHEAVRGLASSARPDLHLPSFLEQVRASLEAAAVELVHCEGGRVTTQWAQAGPGPGPEGATPPQSLDLPLATALLAIAKPSCITALTGTPVISEGLRRRGWRDCLVVPVASNGDTGRALCVYDPKGIVTIDRSDLSVLESLGREVTSALGQGEAQAALRSSEARFRALVQHSSDVVVVVDADGAVTDVLPSRSSRPFALPIGRRLSDIAHPDDAPKIEGCFEKFMADGDHTYSFTWRVASRDGSWRHLETIVTNLLDAPAVAGIVVNSRDVTERERSAALLFGQAEVLGAISRRRPLAETLTTLVEVVDAQTTASGCSVVLLDAPGAPAMVFGEALGDPSMAEVADIVAALAAADVDGPGGEAARPLVRGDTASGWRAALDDDGGVAERWATPIGRSDDGEIHQGFVVLGFGEPRRLDGSDRRVLDSAADLAHLAVEAVAAESRLVHQATHDSLTGLPNRVLFVDRTTVALSRLTRSARSVAVLFVDLDRFKTVNDSLGHDVGDRLLVTLARRLEAVMRPSDTVARFGGDEFTILCEDLHDHGEATAIAARVREALTEPVTLEGHELHVTASVGIAHTSDPHCASHELLEDADAAMYRAKRVGGDVSQVFDVAVRDRALLDLVAEQALRKAIDRHELVVHYQSTFDLSSGGIVGAEALVRWDHPARGVLGPLEFIPLAEETGLIVPLGTHVLHEACAQIQRWDGLVPEDFTLSVNLSARQFADPHLPDVVAAALESTGVRPSALALEITETTLMEHAETTMVVLRALKDLGVRLAIDDFGTGYSSLSYLKRFPVDVLKVDKSFVDGVGRDTGDEAIVRAVVELAHTFGMTAVAEGVETDVQAQVLQLLHCDVAQGYRFSRPVPADQVVFSAVDVIDLSMGDR